MTKTKKPAKTDTQPPQSAGPVEGDVVPADNTAQVPTATQIVLSDQQTNVMGPLIGGISTEMLQQALEVQTEQRKLIKQFVEAHLVDGTDYGRIHVVKKESCKALSAFKACTFDGHYSKRVLFKPGQEKLFSLFQITDQLERDEETYQMFPDARNLVAYKCTLFRSGQPIGHGRGAATLGDNKRDANATIKIAEKRARMDACLSLGFSEYFTQDLDDPDYKQQADMANERARQEAEAAEARRRVGPVTQETRELLARWFKHREVTTGDDIARVMRLNGIDDPSALTEGQALEIASKLSSNVFISPPKTTADVEDMDYPDPAEPKPSAWTPPDAKPARVIDDETKTQLYTTYKMFGFNSRGDMWFMTKAVNKPKPRWEDLTDGEWQKIAILIDNIEAQTVEVDDRYLQGVETVQDGRTAAANDNDIVAGALRAFPDEQTPEEGGDNQ